MRKNILIIIVSILFIPCYGQQLPDDIQHRLDSLKNNVDIALNNYIINPRKGSLYHGELRYEFTYPSYLWDKSNQYNLNIGMLYDDNARERILQLMQNEYREFEIDTLVERNIAWNDDLYGERILEICKFDTTQIFQQTLDSFYIELKKKPKKAVGVIGSKSMYHYEVLKLLKLDTTEIYIKLYNEIVEKERVELREEYLKEKLERNSLRYLAYLCGYIGDKRFIKPLIEALDNPEDFVKETVIEALARMRVEPYYSDYVKQRTRTLEQIKKRKPDFPIKDLVYVIGTQESFLELSKYLLSDCPYTITIIDDRTAGTSNAAYTPISYEAFYLIKDNIKNEDLQKIINKNHISDVPEMATQLYNWMQKNYGNYKIRRIW